MDISPLPSILILGAGIGGLSAAHSLRKRGFQGKITMLEANDIIGGQARSSYVHGSLPGGGGVPRTKDDPDTQYCWRIVSFFACFCMLVWLCLICVCMCVCAVWTQLQGIESHV